MISLGKPNYCDIFFNRLKKHEFGIKKKNYLCAT